MGSSGSSEGETIGSSNIVGSGVSDGVIDIDGLGVIDIETDADGDAEGDMLEDGVGVSSASIVIMGIMLGVVMSGVIMSCSSSSTSSSISRVGVGIDGDGDMVGAIDGAVVEDGDGVGVGVSGTADVDDDEDGGGTMDGLGGILDGLGVIVTASAAVSGHPVGALLTSEASPGWLRSVRRSSTESALSTVQTQHGSPSSWPLVRPSPSESVSHSSLVHSKPWALKSRPNELRRAPAMHC